MACNDTSHACMLFSETPEDTLAELAAEIGLHLTDEEYQQLRGELLGENGEAE